MTNYTSGQCKSEIKHATQRERERCLERNLPSVSKPEVIIRN